MSGAILALLALNCLFFAQGQTLGNIHRGKGGPAGTTYIVPPTGSPFAAPLPAPGIATSQAFSPTADSPDSTTRNNQFSRGQCYCTPAEPQQLACFVNATVSPTANTTTIDCDPPLAYNCEGSTAAAGLYAQLSGPIYNCSVVTPSPAYSPEMGLLSDPQAPSPFINQLNYTLVFQPNSTRGAAPVPVPASSLRYAKTPLIESGQIVDVNPKPRSAGVQIMGVDITMNGQLNGLPLEPPNPAICVGNGFVLEATNDVLIVYSADNGTVVAGPTDYQHFFGVSGPPVNGLSDAYCIYDAADSKRFFVSMSFFSCRTAACLSKGAVASFSYLLLGVSKTSDPRDGFYGPYFIATDAIDPDTNEPYPGFGACGTAPSGFTGTGCLGDYPNPGIDKYGFWFSVNMFTIDADNLIGANVFGVRKAELISGQYANPTVVTYTNWAPYPGFTVVPSITQATWNHSRAQGGSIYLMSSDSFSFTGQNNDSLGIPSIRTWAITNTSLLGQGLPDGQTPVLSAPVTLGTQPLQFSSEALKNPRAPSGTSVPQPFGPILGGQDERMRQVAYSGGLLYSCFNTPVNLTGRIYNGLAYFVLAPNFTSSGKYTARIVTQGYVSTAGSHLLNGAITASANGSAVITGSIVGTGMYLSAFYAHIDPRFGPGPIHVPMLSTNPLLNEGPGQIPQRRTGDYSGATLDEQGNVWIVAEWASDRYTNLRQPDTKNPRFANWGTYIIEIDPYILN